MVSFSKVRRGGEHGMAGEGMGRGGEVWGWGGVGRVGDRAGRGGVERSGEGWVGRGKGAAGERLSLCAAQHTK